MAMKIKLKHHTINEGSRIEPFYTHILWSQDGVIEVEPEDALTAYLRGYSLTPSGRQMLDTNELQDEVTRQITHPIEEPVSYRWR